MSNPLPLKIPLIIADLQCLKSIQSSRSAHTKAGFTFISFVGDSNSIEIERKFLHSSHEKFTQKIAKSLARTHTTSGGVWIKIERKIEQSFKKHSSGRKFFCRLPSDPLHQFCSSLQWDGEWWKEKNIFVEIN